jgi:hypothetical protein
MKQLTIFILACYGMTGIICYSSILAPLRKNKFHESEACSELLSRLLAELLSCPMCSGFWVGLLLNWLLPVTDPWMRLFAAPLVSAGTSYFLCMVVNDDGFRFK